MNCFKWTGTEFEEVAEPFVQDEGGEYVANIMRAGYFPQASSETHESSSGSVVLYENNDKTKPRYFIDLWGSTQQLAGVVAVDFPHLVRTMKELAGLLALIGLEQQTDIQAEAILARRAA
jgi:hypothetical protein